MKKTLLLAVTALAVAQALAIPVETRLYADGSNVTLQQMRDRLVEVNTLANNIATTAEAENRALTDDERRDFDNLNAEFDTLEADIKRYEANAERNMRMQASGHRQVDDPTANGGAQAQGSQQGGAQAQGTQQTRAQAQGSQRQSVPAQPRDNRSAGTWGFQNFGNYLASIRNMSAKSGTLDPRYVANAPSTYGQEGVGADGGFAVPPDFRTEIVKKVMGEDSLLGMADQMVTSSNSITVPLDNTAPWDSSGGIQAYWESEAGQKTQSKIALGELTVKANKVIVLVPMTDELLQDAPGMASYVNKKAPEKIFYKTNEAIIKGTGVGQPLGILNSAGTITVDAVSGQAADTVVFQNILSMYYRMNSASRRKAVWLMNADAEEKLPLMKFIDQGSGNAVPVYMPPGGLSAAPYGTLLGRPIITSEAMPALGDAGDIIFSDMSAYMAVTKGGGIRQDVSIHLFFDYDITAFRFVLRIGGQPWWNSAITRPNGQPTRGFFVALGARS
jgi:HK97 family phage major capsid protein